MLDLPDNNLRGARIRKDQIRWRSSDSFISPFSPEGRVNVSSNRTVPAFSSAEDRIADASRHGLIYAIPLTNDRMDLQRHGVGILCLILIYDIGACY
jgi:hypothetical protein